MMQPRVGRLAADIIIEETGQVWVSMAQPNYWVHKYVKIEEARAKGNRGSGNSGQHSSTRSGRPSQWASDPGVGFDPGVGEGGYKFRDDSDPLNTGRLIHETLEKYFAENLTHPKIKDM